MTSHRITRAVVSVSDKSGLSAFVGELAGYGVSEILSTGGTAQVLRGAQIKGAEIIDVSSYTGFPEMMDGRIKTLHPLIHGGLLGKLGIHDQVMRDHNILPINLVVVNLYPFAETVKKGAGFGECVEQIDIGGPTMIRSAAKNYERVTVVIDPSDYPRVLKSMYDNHGATDLELRQELAAKVFEHTGEYDTAIADYFKKQIAGPRGQASVDPDRIRLMEGS